MPTPAIYSPNSYVTLTHQTPHLSSSLNKASNEYDPSHINAYAISVAIFPLILLGLGILSILLYQIILIGRYTCCKSYCTRVKSGTDEEVDIEQMDRESQSRSIEKSTILLCCKKDIRNIHLYYYSTLFCATVTICCVCFGSINIFTVITNISSSILSLSDSFASISSTTTLISTDGSNTINILNSFECTNMSSSDRSTIINLLHTLMTNVSSINQRAQAFSTNLKIYDSKYTTVPGLPSPEYVLYLYIVILLLNVLLLLISWRLRKKWVLSVTIVLTEVIVFVLTVVACSLLFLSVSSLCIMYTYLLYTYISYTPYIHAHNNHIRR